MFFQILTMLIFYKAFAVYSQNFIKFENFKLQFLQSALTFDSTRVELIMNYGYR